MCDTQELPSFLSIVSDQADDEGLWFVARTAPEAYLQQELRRLHAAIERAYIHGNVPEELSENC